MRSVSATVDHRDGMIQLIYAMVTSRRSLLLVTKKDRIIGVVRSVEVLGELSLIIRED